MLWISAILSLSESLQFAQSDTLIIDCNTKYSCTDLEYHLNTSISEYTFNCQHQFSCQRLSIFQSHKIEQNISIICHGLYSCQDLVVNGVPNNKINKQITINIFDGCYNQHIIHCNKIHGHCNISCRNNAHRHLIIRSPSFVVISERRIPRSRCKHQFIFDQKVHIETPCLKRSSEGTDIIKLSIIQEAKSYEYRSHIGYSIPGARNPKQFICASGIDCKISCEIFDCNRRTINARMASHLQLECNKDAHCDSMEFYLGNTTSFIQFNDPHNNAIIHSDGHSDQRIIKGKFIKWSEITKAPLFALQSRYLLFLNEYAYW